MPKDEFDFEDPLELNGVAFPTPEDTTDVMCECFIEEFMRLGYNHKQVLALFRNPHYMGMNLVLEQRGEPFIRNCIGEIFARWGRPVTWPTVCDSREAAAARGQSLVASAARNELKAPTTDLIGAAIPKLDL